MTTLYVKKIVSVNPTRYKHIALNKALKKYHNYFVSCLNSPYKTKKPKDFSMWLKTEI